MLTIALRAIQVFGVAGIVGAIWLGNHAFDVHDKGLVVVAAALGFGAIGALGLVGHRIRSSRIRPELIMNDEWEPIPRFNPATGLPMLDGSIDAHGNHYGTHSSDAHRLGT